MLGCRDFDKFLSNLHQKTLCGTPYLPYGVI
jgi:hypothetical protein